MKRRSGDNLFVCSVVVCIIYAEVACWHNLIDTSRNENKRFYSRIEIINLNC